MPHFLYENPHLDISIRLLDSIKISQTDVNMYESKIIGKGKNIIKILFHKSNQNKNPVTDISG